MKTKLFTLILTCYVSVNFAQLKLADQFYKKYDYPKAIELYEEVVKNGDSSMKVLTRIGDAYYNNTQTEQSAKWYKLAINKYEGKIEPEYIFKYIQSLVSIKEYSKAKLWVKKLKKIQNENPKVEKYINDDFDIEKLKASDKKSDIKLKNLSFNSKYSDFGAYVYNNTLYFASSRDTLSEIYDWNKEPYLDIYQVEVTRNNRDINYGDFEKIKSNDINSDYHESSVAITNDGKTMYFTRDNLNKSKRLKHDSKGTTHLELFKVTLDENTNQWINLESLPFNDDVYSTGHPVLSPDNKRLFFASNRKGGFGSADLYVVEINEDGSYSKPKNLGKNINTAGRELFPSISQDSTLYYSSDGLVNQGLLDIYKSDYLKNPDAKSESLGKPFNSGFDDFAYIYNSETQQGYLSSNRKGGKGSDDIYSFSTYKCTINVNGVTRDKLTDNILPNVTVKLIDETGKIISEQISNTQGKYNFKDLPCEKNYTIIGSKQDYKNDQKSVATSVNDKKMNQANLILTPLIIDNQIVINPIFFDFDKSNIRTDASYELENIVDVMRKHPTMVIKIESHTDSRGDDNYNMKLSDRRAKSTRDYILSRGIETNRIESAIGYGESQLLNKCLNGVDCSEEEHQKNRRSYFYILKK